MSTEIEEESSRVERAFKFLNEKGQGLEIAKHEDYADKGVTFRTVGPNGFSIDIITLSPSEFSQFFELMEEFENG